MEIWRQREIGISKHRNMEIWSLGRKGHGGKYEEEEVEEEAV
jgi:hypothetical protein